MNRRNSKLLMDKLLALTELELAILIEELSDGIFDNDRSACAKKLGQAAHWYRKQVERCVDYEIRKKK